MDNFSNQLQLTKPFNQHTFSIGAYTGHYSVGNTWFFNDILTDVRTQPRLLNLVARGPEGALSVATQNGFQRYGSFFVNANGDVDILALFAGDQIEINERLRLDVGVRVEENDFRQFAENINTFDLGDPTTTADDAVTGGTGSITQRRRSFDETAVSIGVNYLLNDNVAIWGRAGTGYKMPILDNFLFGDVEVAESLTQYEAGTRIGTPKVGLNLTAYLVNLQDFPTSDARIDPDTGETIFEIAFVGEAETVGRARGRARRRAGRQPANRAIGDLAAARVQALRRRGREPERQHRPPHRRGDHRPHRRLHLAAVQPQRQLELLR